MNDEGKHDHERKRSVTAARLMAELFDGIDEDKANKLRGNLGQKGWIVSWIPAEGETWVARVSVTRVPRTIERIGRTRVEAISRAVGSLGTILELRTKRITMPEIK